jgi:glutamyl-tRNA synthetase
MDDQVLLKSDGYPTYHLGVVVDDHLMNISHVIRGEEWISSTPKHVLLYEAFDWPLPVYAHAPDLLSPTGKGKMSKRQGDVSAQSFLDKGYLPEAMLNFLMILGWASSDQEEILDMDRYIREFDVKDISKKSVAFDTNKLDYLNGVYIRRMSDAELTDALRPFKAPELTEDLFREFIPLIKERLVKLSDFSELSVYLCRAPEIFGERLIKESKMDATQTAEFLRQVIDVVGKSAWNTGELEAELRGLQQQLKMKPRPAFMTLRLAVTGQQATPPLFEVMVILGKDEVVKRLTQALSVL